MKTPLLFIVLLVLVFAPAAPAQLSQARLDAIEREAYEKALAEIKARRAAEAAGTDPLAAPVPPAADAGPEAWARYNNAVAAWNQRTAAQKQQQAAEAARQRQIEAAAVQAEVARRMAAKEERMRRESEAAYRAWLAQRAVEALELHNLLMAERMGLVRR